MKKQTKNSLTVKLDRECSRIVRARGGCQWCGEPDYSKLQCAHIFSRTFRNTRWDLHNLICLCARCHFEAHQKPILFTEFVRNVLGEYFYASLKSNHNAIKRWTVTEMEELWQTLKQL